MIVLTFDVEEWFHILDPNAPSAASEWDRYESRIHENIHRILALLEQKRQPATFFCLGWIAEKYPDVIREISDAGHEIASHSMNHQLVHRMDERAFREDTQRSIDVLENISGKKVRAYRAPGFSFTRDTEWAFDVLHSLGIEIDCSIVPSAYDHGGFPGLNMREPFILERGGIELKAFPMSFVKLGQSRLIVSGGGYFRLLPWPVIARLLNSQLYNMSYFHPRDFDVSQPRFPDFTSVRRFKSYVGLKGALEKLNKLLDQIECYDLAGSDELTDWRAAPRISFNTVSAPG